MDIDINKLKEETLAAVKRGKELKAQKMLDDNEKEKLRHTQAKAWAESNALTVPALAQEAARKGLNKVTVARIDDYYATHHNFPHNEFHGWDTSKTGLRYYMLEQILLESGLDVSVEFQHDGVGIRSWYEIYVSW